jgi:hypothetical protein
MYRNHLFFSAFSHMWCFVKKSFELFQKQVNKLDKLELPHPPTWRHNLMMVQFVMNNLTRPVPPDPHEMSSFWNPLCAGTFLSYITYYVSLEGGSAMVDSVGQVRIVLHLYNAAKQCNLIQPGNLYIVDQLDEMFKSSKAIWGSSGTKPKKGDFAKNYLIIFGYSPLEAERFLHAVKGSSGTEIFRRSHGRSAGRLYEIKPEELSKGFRQIVLCDFSLVEDKYHNAEQRRRARNSSMYEFAVRSNDTLDTVVTEQAHLSINLIALGELLNQFVYSMANVLKWRPLIDEIYQNLHQKSGRVRLMDGRTMDASSWENSKEFFTTFNTAMLFSVSVLGTMDWQVGRIPGESEAFGATMWLENFFPRMSPSNLLFFMPTEFDSDDDDDNVELHVVGERL